MLLFLSQTHYHRYADMLSDISIMLGFVFTWFTVYHNLLITNELILEHHKQGHHALIIFEGGRVGGGGGRHVTYSSSNSTYVLLSYFLFLESFPDTLIITWNISIITFIDYVSWSIVGDGQSSLTM